MKQISLQKQSDLKRGVFWIVEGKLLAFPFDESAQEGIAKSGKTYNHKLLWEHIKPCNKPFDYYPRPCNKPFDYYPRGRVGYNAKGAAIIYMNPQIEDKYRSEIKAAFRITSDPICIPAHAVENDP